jgi:hypothetical protein
MTERPILFKGEMVKAIRNGQKTQTRRIWKMPPGMGWYVSGALRGEETGDICDLTGPGWCSVDEVTCPYGRSGDRLWVRESHAPQSDCWGSWDAWMRQDTKSPKPIIHYKADDGRPWVDKWRPSIHMPRWASRLTLEITEADAIAEGIEARCNGWAWYTGRDKASTYTTQPITSYRSLWESINGPESWFANPWVWVVTFKEVEC